MIGIYIIATGTKGLFVQFLHGFSIIRSRFNFDACSWIYLEILGDYNHFVIIHSLKFNHFRVGSTLGATLAFIIGRTLARSYVF